MVILSVFWYWKKTKTGELDVRSATPFSVVILTNKLKFLKIDFRFYHTAFLRQDPDSESIRDRKTEKNCAEENREFVYYIDDERRTLQRHLTLLTSSRVTP